MRSGTDDDGSAISAELTTKKEQMIQIKIETDTTRNRISADELGVPFCSTRFTDGK